MKKSNYLISAQILNEQRRDLDIICAYKGSSMAYLIRESLNEYIKKNLSEIENCPEVLIPTYRSFKGLSLSAYGFYVSLYSKMSENKFKTIKLEDIKRFFLEETTNLEHYLSELIKFNLIKLNTFDIKNSDLDEYSLTGIPGDFLNIKGGN